ncbi:MarR family winged helix-turn-helix transcriptional regulator [Roseococcus sp. YIM B11640]|uniref:MarR family winged helix-turn-helix transcriptional regulator n=1 Tax=Roseococcus sp. YIM B11640 TaxID=3133973 RepID=UPI003C7C83A2
MADRPGFLIRRMHQLHVALFAELAAEFGVTPVQYSLMSAIASRGAADQSTLAADVGLDKSTAAGTLARLEARGLIRRRRDAGDGRVMLCTLSRAGRALLPRIEPAAREAHRRTLARLSSRDADQLMALLRAALAEP